MIRRLRRKLVAITSVLLTALLLLILIFVYVTTGSQMERDSVETLERTAAIMVRPDGGQIRIDGRCFLLERHPDGTFVALGSSDFGLEDRQVLEVLMDRVLATGQRTGVLEDLELRFHRAQNAPGVKYAFMDISGERQTMSRLLTGCVVIFLLGTAAFFLTGILLARWAVRPVEEAMSRQQQFVADASHELKTPLTVILTNAELLTDPARSQEDKDRFARSILTMSGQMRGLVEALLEQARLDDGAAKVQWTEVDLSRLVSDAVLPFEPVYFEAGKELLFQIQPGLEVRGSTRHLRQVVEILLDNGCKYSDPGGQVRLCLRRHEKNILLSVTSPGPDLTAEQCRDIFKRFYRLDTARKMDHSYGLGLSIAQSIVTEHRGRIWARSEGGQNTFFVSLPERRPYGTAQVAEGA